MAVASQHNDVSTSSRTLVLPPGSAPSAESSISPSRRRPPSIDTVGNAAATPNGGLPQSQASPVNAPASVHGNSPAKSRALEGLRLARDQAKSKRRVTGGMQMTAMISMPKSENGLNVATKHLAEEAQDLRRRLEEELEESRRRERQLEEKLAQAATTPKPQSPTVSLQQANMLLSDEVASLRRQADEEREAAAGREQALEVRAARLEAERLDLESKLMEKLQSEGNELQARLVAVEAEAAASNREKATLACTCDELKHQLDASRREQDALVRQRDELRNVNDRLAAQQEESDAAHREEVEDLKEELERQKEASVKLERDRDSARQVCALLEEEKQAQKEKMQDLEKQRNQLVERLSQVAAAGATQPPSQQPAPQNHNEASEPAQGNSAEAVQEIARLKSELKNTAAQVNRERVLAERREQDLVRSSKEEVAGYVHQQETLRSMVESLQHELAMTRKERASKLSALLGRTEAFMSDAQVNMPASASTNASFATPIKPAASVGSTASPAGASIASPPPPAEKMVPVAPAVAPTIAPATAPPGPASSGGVADLFGGTDDSQAWQPEAPSEALIRPAGQHDEAFSDPFAAAQSSSSEGAAKPAQALAPQATAAASPEPPAAASDPEPSRVLSDAGFSSDPRGEPDAGAAAGGTSGVDALFGDEPSSQGEASLFGAPEDSQASHSQGGQHDQLLSDAFTATVARPGISEGIAANPAEVPAQPPAAAEPVAAAAAPVAASASEPEPSRGISGIGFSSDPFGETDAGAAASGTSGVAGLFGDEPSSQGGELFAELSAPRVAAAGSAVPEPASSLGGGQGVSDLFDGMDTWQGVGISAPLASSTMQPSNQGLGVAAFLEDVAQQSAGQGISNGAADSLFSDPPPPSDPKPAGVKDVSDLF